MEGVPGVRGPGRLRVLLRAPRRQEWPLLQLPGCVVGGSHPHWDEDAPPRPSSPLVPVRRRTVALHHGRRHHVQLPTLLPPRDPVPLDRRRLLPERLSLPDRRHPRAGEASLGGPGPRGPDRLADHHDRCRVAVVGVPDGAVRPGPHADAAPQGDAHRLSDDGRPVAGRRRPAGSGRRAARRGVLPLDVRNHGVARHGRRVRSRPGLRRRVSERRTARGRLALVLRPVGRRGAAPVDAPIGRSPAEGPVAVQPRSPSSARRRIPDGAVRADHPGPAERADRRTGRDRGIGGVVPAGDPAHERPRPDARTRRGPGARLAGGGGRPGRLDRPRRSVSRCHRFSP